MDDEGLLPRAIPLEPERVEDTQYTMPLPREGLFWATTTTLPPAVCLHCTGVGRHLPCCPVGVEEVATLHAQWQREDLLLGILPNYAGAVSTCRECARFYREAIPLLPDGVAEKLAWHWEMVADRVAQLQAEHPRPRVEEPASTRQERPGQTALQFLATPMRREEMAENPRPRVQAPVPAARKKTRRKPPPGSPTLFEGGS